jgi:hypothetical protein
MLRLYHKMETEYGHARFPAHLTDRPVTLYIMWFEMFAWEPQP